MSLHPELGVHVHAVIPSTWGAFVDVYACYEVATRTRPWLSVLSPAAFDANGSALGDSSNVYVLWEPSLRVPPRAERDAMVGIVYSEALGDPAHMLVAHKEQLARFHAESGDLDAVFLHTPWMQTQFAPHAPAYVLPVGWEPEAMGRPRWNSPKHRAYVYHGSMAGKRQFTVPFLTEHLSDQFFNATGSFGRALLGTLDTAQAALYLGHSDVASFSTWRIWQALSTSAALVAEPGDSWPMEPGRHFYQLPRIDYTNIGAVASELRQLAAGNTLGQYARRAHDDLSWYTTGRIVDDFLVPAVRDMQERRRGPHG